MHVWEDRLFKLTEAVTVANVEKESRTIGSEFGRSLSTRISGANGKVRDSMDVVDGRGT